MTRYLSFLLSVLILTATGAAAQQEAAYTIRIAGFTVGDLRLSATETGRAYSVASAITSAGAARVFRPFSYEARAKGTIVDGRLAPARYEEQADTGRRQSEAVMEYRQGVPDVVRYTSPIPDGADAPAPATQGGTVDPLTAMYALLRPRPEAELCDRRIVLFDGRRRSHLVLGPATREADRIVCSGEYRRLAGFTPDELKRHVAFPLAAVFAPAGSDGDYAAVHVELKSVYGLATVDRR